MIAAQAGLRRIEHDKACSSRARFGRNIENNSTLADKSMRYGYLSYLLRVILIGVLVLAAGCSTLPKDSSTQETDPKAAEKAKAAIIRGDNAWRDGDLDRAILEYVTALGFDSTNAEALHKVARIHAFKKNYARAEKAFRQVLAKEKDDPESLEGLGLVLLKQQRHEEAQETLSKAVALEPHLWRAQNGLGVVYDLLQEHQRAQRHYQAALQESPGSALVLNNLGYSHYLSGDWTSAQAYFRRVLTKDPSNEHAWSNLGLVYVRQQRYDEATQAFQQIMDPAQAANTIGYLCMADGKDADAERFLMEAIRLSPSYFSAAHTNLARLRAKDREEVSANPTPSGQLDR
jgi:Flp pilus assembly protein TadD